MSMKCCLCGCVVTQQEADEAAETVGPGWDTMCPRCALTVELTHPDPEDDA